MPLWNKACSPGDTLDIWAPFLASEQNSFHLSHRSLAVVLEDLEQEKILLEMCGFELQHQYLYFTSSHQHYKKQSQISW